jgi:cytoskeleton protein RodZ
MTTPGSPNTPPEPSAEFRSPAPEALHKPEPLRGPGQILRAARESARLSLDSLAAQTKLARNTLEALERDDFAILKEAVYVRGYYRKCAKALNIGEAELLAAYEKLAGPKAPPAPPTRPLLGGGNAGLERSRRSLGGWIPLLVVVIAAGGFVGWLLRNESGKHVIAGVSGPAPLAETPAETSSTEQTPAPTPTPTPAPDASSPAPAPAAAETTPAPAEAAPASAAPAAAAAAPSGQALVLDFKATSWVRIQDADGKTLLSGVIQQGQHPVLEGKPPYSVYIGNARGVDVQYAGSTVDLGPFIKDNDTAKLTVPAGN